MTNDTELPQAGLVDPIVQFNEFKKNLDNPDAETFMYLLKSINFQHQLLNSGKVLYHKRINQYLNGVVDILLNNDPRAQEIEVFTYLSSDVNAFTTDLGIIVISVGLLARLQTEAELASILSHEIQHYLGQHSIHEFVKVKKTMDQDRRYLEKDQGKIELRKLRISRALETVADIEGLKLFLKSPYNPTAVTSSLSLLQNADAPLFDRTWNHDLFESTGFQIPGSYKENIDLKEHPAFHLPDSLKTHPNIQERIDTLTKMLASESLTGKDFVVGASEFDAIRTLCQIELTNIMFDDGRYFSSFYNAYVSRGEHPKNTIIKEQMILAVNAMAWLHLHKEQQIGEGEIIPPNSEMGSALKFFAGLSDYELCLLSTQLAWKHASESPQIQDIGNFLLHELVFHFPDALEALSFLPAPKPSVNKTEEKEVQEEKEIPSGGILPKSLGLPFNERIANPNKTAIIKKKTDIPINHVFEGFSGDSTFRRAFSEALALKKPTKKGPLFMKTIKFHPRLKTISSLPKQVYNQKALTIELGYKQIESRFDHHNSYNQLIKRSKWLKEVAKKSIPDSKLVFLDESHGKATQLNESIVLNNWLSLMMLENKSGCRPYNQFDLPVQSIMEKYSVEHLQWAGIILYNKPIQTEYNNDGYYTSSIYYHIRFDQNGLILQDLFGYRKGFYKGLAKLFIRRVYE